MEGTLKGRMTFWARWKVAWRVLWDSGYAGRMLGEGGEAGGGAKETAAGGGVGGGDGAGGRGGVEEAAPERVHASGLHLLAALQREGRLIDFVQQDVTGFSDEDVAAAARVVHEGCRRVLRQGLELGPAIGEAEGAAMVVPAGFDAGRIRLVGNVAGQPPFRGVVRHPGWVVREVRLPEVTGTMDPRVLAAAEVELS